MTNKMIRTAWGSKQLAVDGLPELSQEEEAGLRQEWRSPHNFWKVLNSEFSFDTDVAASAENTLCPSYICVEDDALSDYPWIRPNNGILRAYCNPGFGNMSPWIEKAAQEVVRDTRAIICVLGLCAPSTKWWQKAVASASEIRLLAPRVQFQAPDPRIPHSSNARDCAVFVFRGNGVVKEAHITTWQW